MSHTEVEIAEAKQVYEIMFYTHGFRTFLLAFVSLILIVYL